MDALPLLCYPHPSSARARRSVPPVGWSGRETAWRLAVIDEVGGVEDEDLAHHVGVLLVAAHEADHVAAGGLLDDRGEALAQELLELHALLDDRRAAPARQQRLLHAREAPAQQADHEIVLVVGLRSRGPAPVELLQQRDHAVRDRGEDVAVLARGWFGARTGH